MTMAHQNHLFDIEAKMYQNPAYVSPRGTRVQGLFTIKPISQAVKRNALQGLIESTDVLVLDTSSSMEGEGIDALKLTVVTALKAMPNGNRVGVIVFAGSNTARWLFVIETLTDKSRQKMITAVENLSASGMTCFSQALDLALVQLEQESAVVKQIEFMSDGQSTDGHFTIPGRGRLNDVEATLEIAKSRINGKVGLNVYGMGMGYDKGFMDELVQNAGGEFYHVLGDGTGLDQLMGTNVARAGHAVAAGVIVEIKCQNGFTFSSSDDDTGQPRYDVYRTAPNKTRVRPRSDNFLVDAVGTVNDVEGVPYEITFVGPAIQPPLGQDVWHLSIATISVRYKLADGEHVETLDVVQSFTTDISKVQQDASVATTMRQTALQVTAADAAQNYSVAQTMGNTAAMKAASIAATMAQEQAARGGLTALSADLTDLVQGMESGDADKVRANRTRMVNSADLSQFVDGMDSGGTDNE